MCYCLVLVKLNSGSNVGSASILSYMRCPVSGIYNCLFLVVFSLVSSIG